MKIYCKNIGIVAIYFICLVLPFISTAQKNAYAAIETKYGTIIVQLSNLTPKHRDNFIQKVKERFFDTTLFHRVVPNFVIQGGDPDSLFTTPKDTALLKAQRLMPEYHDALFHKRGAFGMGRDDNPLEANFFTQIYIVQGRKWTDAEMDALEKRVGKEYTIPESKRAIYRTIGGQPRLDGDYTIFGEVVQGMEVVDVIANVKAFKELPIEPVRMKIRMLRKRSARKLERTARLTT